MKPSILMLAMSVALGAGAANAHAHLHASTPANNSVLTETPKQVRLEFNEPVQLTAATIQKGDGAATKLGPLPAGTSKEFTLGAPALEFGAYIMKWRVISDDGHIMAGKVLFTVGVPAK